MGGRLVVSHVVTKAKNGRLSFWLKVCELVGSSETASDATASLPPTLPPTPLAEPPAPPSPAVGAKRVELPPSTAEASAPFASPPISRQSTVSMDLPPISPSTPKRLTGTYPYPSSRGFLSADMPPDDGPTGLQILCEEARAEALRRTYPSLRNQIKNGGGNGKAGGAPWAEPVSPQRRDRISERAFIEALSRRVATAFARLGEPATAASNLAAMRAASAASAHSYASGDAAGAGAAATAAAAAALAIPVRGEEMGAQGTTASRRAANAIALS